MKKSEFAPVGLVLGAYVLLPLFFKIGPVSVYHFLVIDVFILYACRRKVRIKTRTSWVIRGILLLTSMFYHGEWNAMLVYAVTPGLLGVLICMCVRCHEDVDRLMDVLIYTSVINFAICIVESVTGINLSYLLCTDESVTYIPLLRLGIQRVYGAFVNPINNGMYCVFVQIACLYRISSLLSTKKKRRMWWFYTCNWIVLILTFSRAAILIALGANGFLLIKMRFLRMNPWQFIIGITFLVVMVLFLAVPNALMDKLTVIALPFLKIADDLLGTQIVSGIAGTASVQGIGDRINLYRWVPDVMENMWFGEGRTSEFSYVVNVYGHTKKSIENQYLCELYTHGIVSLVGKVLLFLSSLLYALKWALREWRIKKPGFNTCMLAAYASYFVILFTVAQSEEKKVFYIFLVLQLLYNDVNQKKHFFTLERGL